MPRLPQSFSAYPATVVLDGSGNGSVYFQATGSNIRVNNISVRVTTSTAQAIATIYKGQIGNPYRLSGTNSGSTGDSISTPIDLFDGEGIYVVWTGGDAGASATATFSGNVVPKGDVGTGVGGNGWSNPIAAGDGTLIYPALKSPNYVPTLDGWQIARNGSAEFFNIFVRAGGVVVRNEGNGRSVTIDSQNVGFYPADPVNVTKQPGFINATLVDSATVGVGSLSIQSASVNSLDASRINMYGNNVDGTNRQIQMIGDVKVTDGEISNLSDNMVYMRGEQGVFNFNLIAATSASTAVSFTNTFASAPVVTTNIESGSGTIARWNSRAINVTTSGFTLFIFKGDAADPAATLNPVPVSWRATI